MSITWNSRELSIGLSAEGETAPLGRHSALEPEIGADGWSAPQHSPAPPPHSVHLAGDGGHEPEPMPLPLFIALIVFVGLEAWLIGSMIYKVLHIWR